MYPQHNYPHLAFLLDNIRPISANCNRQQLDTVANWIDKTPLTTEEKAQLAEKAHDNGLKGELRNSQYYQGMYEKFKALNTIEKKRLAVHGERSI